MRVCDRLSCFIVPVRIWQKKVTNDFGFCAHTQLVFVSFLRILKNSDSSKTHKIFGVMGGLELCEMETAVGVRLTLLISFPEPLTEV